MLKRLILALLSVAVLAGCGDRPLSPSELATRTANDRRGVSTDEYAVYSAIIASRWPAEKLIVIWADTSDHDVRAGPDFQRPVIRDLASEAIDHLLAANEQTYPLYNEFTVPNKRLFWSREDMAALFGSGDVQGRWRDFYQKYPSAQGLLSFSRVGFDRRKTQAIVFVANSTYGAESTGHFVFLRREAAGWRVQEQVLKWVV